MSNFKERQASAKKVIQLQNEILSLKQELSSRVKAPEPEPCEDCSKLVQEVQSIINSTNQDLSLLRGEVASLKAELKRTRSENTRLKNKLKDEQE
jgi:hypothetical protein